MTTIEKMRGILRETLGLGERANGLTPETRLLGNLPELDSMAVVEVVASIEGQFGVRVYDDEISAETFATLESLADFVDGKTQDT